MASSSSAPPRKHEVFLSFRGEDTRKTFVGHLYTALDQKGIVTYKDDQNLEKGQSISAELMKVIEESRFAIIVFSKNYSSSTWCLDELVKIMECHTEHGQTVIPIFYDVDPSDVRKQKNSFAESFSKHEVNFKDNTEKVQIWKENLIKAADLTGVDIRGEDEASCIKKIVDEIFSKLLPEPSTKDLVGMESRMREMSLLLFKEPDSVRFVGIWGMGGIGKTTLARAIYYKFISKFEAGYFLQDVSKERDMRNLQKKLLKEILKSESIDISDEHGGSRMMEDRLRHKKVLLVLDDVNNLDQLNSLAGHHTWFGPGSRIIITTRDKHLLDRADNVDVYGAQLLTEGDAMQLFCQHAFEQNQPHEDYCSLSNCVVSYAKGLPLALKVLGSHLRGRGIKFWKSALDRLKDEPENEIFTSLKISLDGLSNIQKETFLDLACFGRWRFGDDAEKMLHSRGFHPEESIPVLVQRCLVHIEGIFIQMHDLIEEMGRHIVQEKANKRIERYSRLWLEDDIINVLTTNTGTSKTEALAFEGIKFSKINFIDETSDLLYFRREGDDINTSKAVFRKMKKLRLLHFVHALGSTGAGAPDYFPNTLRYLCWFRYEGKYLPKDFRPVNLVHLELRWSLIVETPDFSCMPNLEVLDLERSEKLLQVHPSVGVHKRLVHLNLRFCYKLSKFPRSIQMESLEILNLEHCSEFQNFPEIDGKMSRLRILDLRKSRIEELPWSFGNLTSLQRLNLGSCRELRRLPTSLCGLEQLEFIDLRECSKLEYFFESPGGEVVLCYSKPPSLKRKRVEEYYNVPMKIIPKSIGGLLSLKELHFDENNFVSFPESISRLSCLQVLSLCRSKMLEALPELPSSIEILELNYCTALKRIPSLVDLLGKCEHLHRLSSLGCKQLVQTSRIVSNILCTRQEIVEVYLPKTEFPDWLYRSTGPLVTFTLSPSSYNKKLRGFALCGISAKTRCRFNLLNCNKECRTLNEIRRIMNGRAQRSDDATCIFYIPIGIITSGREKKDQEESPLFEVTCKGSDTSWGIHLVYEGEVDKDISHLTITNHYGPIGRARDALMIEDTGDARMTVCIAAVKNGEKEEVFPAIATTASSEKPTFKLFGTYIDVD